MKPTFALRHFASAASLIEETCWSPTRIVPDVGRSMPAMRLRSVVLPEPEGPMSATKSPSSTDSDNLSRTVRTCVSRVYCFTSESMRMRVVPGVPVAPDESELMILLLPRISLSSCGFLLGTPGMSGGRGVRDDLLAARKAGRHLHLRAGGGTEAEGLERSPLVRDEEDAL